MSRGGDPLRIDGTARGASCRFLFDGRPIDAHEGETVAAALWAVGVRTLRHSPGRAEPRGAFCFMGSCQECVVMGPQGVVEACRLRVTLGLEVRRIEHEDAAH